MDAHLNGAEILLVKLSVPRTKHKATVRSIIRYGVRELDFPIGNSAVDNFDSQCASLGRVQYLICRDMFTAQRFAQEERNFPFDSRLKKVTCGNADFSVLEFVMAG